MNMQPASIEDIKKELQQQQPKTVLELLLKLARFKKENKELLTYLLFEKGDEAGYVQSIKLEIDDLISQVDGAPYTVSKKVLRKIPRIINKQIKYMASKPAAAELHLHFSRQLQGLAGLPTGRAIPEKLFMQQLGKLEKLMPSLDEDLRHDYEKQVAEMQLRNPGKKPWWKR
jgi:hypothetical protein